jgi:aminoglycoside phosphotransferase (APT) family kinase protein
VSDSTPTPNAALAAAAAKRATGLTPVEVRRFPTGVAHYVYEALLEDGDAIVVRMGHPSQRGAMQDGLLLAKRLRPLGVPLPRILADGFDDPCPWVAMERLPGKDLGEAIQSLSPGQLQDIARRVAEAQRAAARVGSAGRYGYAVAPETAPYSKWSAVLYENIARSRGRIASTGSFDLEIVDIAADLVDRLRSELDAQPSIPFLHDTTTRNVIVAPQGVLSGIVDVDDLCFGDQRYPAALTLAVLLGIGGPMSYVDAWLEAAGHADDRLFRLYVVMFLVDLMSEDGQVFNGNERPREVRIRAALLKAFEENVALVSA